MCAAPLLEITAPHPLTANMSPELCPAAHISGMKYSSWSLAPARLGPVPLDPQPLKNANSPGFPTSAVVARAYAAEIKAERARRVPWRKIAEKMSISRIEAIRLAHSLDEVLDEIREAESPENQPEAVSDSRPNVPLPPSLPLRLVR